VRVWRELLPLRYRVFHSPARFDEDVDWVEGYRERHLNSHVTYHAGVQEGLVTTRYGFWVTTYWLGSGHGITASGASDSLVRRLFVDLGVPREEAFLVWGLDEVEVPDREDWAGP
jgi:hypothetical protein